MLSLVVSLLSIPVIPAGETFSCTPIRVWDGDGPVWCSEGPRVRLAGIAAREMDETCNANQPCPRASARASRDFLVSLLGEHGGISQHGHVVIIGPRIRCVSTGSAGGTRTGAWCQSPRSGDISCRMVESGYAARWDRYWGSHRCSN